MANIWEMRVWFAAWTAANDHARDEYERTCEQIDALGPDGEWPMCRKQLHDMTPENTITDRRGYANCAECTEIRVKRSNARSAERRRARRAAAA